jgi:hypothetical protein
MNVDMFFVRTDRRDAVIGCIEERLRSEPDLPDKQPDWGLESSYDVLLAKDPKRKVVVSPVQKGWIAAIESKEVLDFAMLQAISERLACEVVACQLANIADSCGYARCCSGQLVERTWLENDPDPLGTLRAYLQERSVPFDLVTFREAVQLRNTGWQILQRQ